MAFKLLSCNINLAAEETNDPKNYFKFFGGFVNSGVTESVVGVEYEYKFNKDWGAGLLYEFYSDAHSVKLDAHSTIASAFYHPSDGWKVGLGFGTQNSGREIARNENIYRLGLSYAFSIEGVGVEPSINIDNINGEISKVSTIAVIWSF